VKAVAVIPSRLGSTRLPEKALLHETGKFLFQHVWERVRQAHRVGRVIVATDHARIIDAARSFGAEAVLTSPSHLSGTDRVAEVARTLPDAGQNLLVVNVQGDEPEIDPADLDLLVDALDSDRECSIATLATPFTSDAALAGTSAVKVVVDAVGRALYFSRSVIPNGAVAGATPPQALKHRGVYAFRRAKLLELAALPPAPLEQIERLEQLRWLHHGERIRVAITPRDGIGIDTPEDYRRFVRGGVR
jgi:3-deoxy-manno-octulosonate cytidylyltransferase (CMP-KDO synthetase)